MIEELEAIQENFGYLPERELRGLAMRLGLPLYHLQGVASFYPHFRLRPQPRTTVHICTDLACHLKNADAVLAQAQQLAQGNADVEVKRCSCLGQCDRAPAALVDGVPVVTADGRELLAIIGRAIEGRPAPTAASSPASRTFRSNPYGDGERYTALRNLIASGDSASVPAKLKDANLRGMGGGGFAAHIKWSSVRSQPEGDKYIVCNADESEVGTFKDREILRHLPHLVIEAMAIAGLTTGATRGYIYIRHEYHEQIEVMKEELRRARELGALGQNVLGSGKAFHLDLFISAGGYIQGEETALLEAIEGKRGQPRNKPCIPAIAGLWNKPTLINNVETFLYVPLILCKGPEWFRNQGVNGCEGLKWIGVAGHVQCPGAFEVPMGTPFSEAFAMAGGIIDGRSLKAFTPSGPSFGFLPASCADIPIDFPDPTRKNPIFQAGATIGSAAIIAIAEGTDMVDLALNFTRFYRNESCGKCVPCRIGSQKMVDIIASLMQGNATQDDLATIGRLADTLDMTSICGLGQVVSRPFQSVMKHWPGEVESYLKGKPSSRPRQEVTA